jgi:uncharacterized cupredoxin-like copper-binding protein
MKQRFVVLLAAIALVAGGCAKPASITATLKDFQITLSSSTGKAGDFTFKITNNGPSVHEFVVFKTDLDEAKLPTKDSADGPLVDEEGAGLKAIDEKEDIAVKSTTELNVKLEKGNYVVICNVATHYNSGMHHKVTVT